MFSCKPNVNAKGDKTTTRIATTTVTILKTLLEYSNGNGNMSRHGFPILCLLNMNFFVVHSGR